MCLKGLEMSFFQLSPKFPAAGPRMTYFFQCEHFIKLKYFFRPECPAAGAHMTDSFQCQHFMKLIILPAGARMTDTFQFEHFIILLYILYLFSLLYHRNNFTIL